MQKQSTENVQKRSRAPKATATQMEFLLSYMENHNAFATGKLLGARGKAAHDAQWQQLREKLNSLDGPSKSMDAWKKLWCDQRNLARARAAKGKAQQKLTGNIGKQVDLKDSDLRILSIIGGELSVGLPIMEIGVGKRLEDIADPSLVLGIKSNTRDEDLTYDNIVNYGETNVKTSNKENISITDDDSILSQDSLHEEGFSLSNYDDSINIATDSISTQYAKKCKTNNQQSATSTITPFKATTTQQTTILMSGKRPRNSFRKKIDHFQNIREKSPEPNYQSDTEGFSPHFDESTSPFTTDQCSIPVKEASKQLASTSKSDSFTSKYPTNSFNEKIFNRHQDIQKSFPENNQPGTNTFLSRCIDDVPSQPKEVLKRLAKSNRLNSKIPRNSSFEETMIYLKDTQVKQNESSEAIVENLNRIAFAVEKQNNLVERLLALHEGTLQILSETVKDLTGRM